MVDGGQFNDSDKFLFGVGKRFTGMSEMLLELQPNFLARITFLLAKKKKKGCCEVSFLSSLCIIRRYFFALLPFVGSSSSGK